MGCGLFSYLEINFLDVFVLMQVAELKKYYLYDI